MSAKGSKLSRALAFFREEPDTDVVRVAYQLVTEIVRKRVTPTGRSVAHRKRTKANATPQAHNVPSQESVA